MRASILAFALLAACTANVDMYEEPELDADDELQMIDQDTSMPEQPNEDTDTSEVAVIAKVACTKQRFLHIANYSFVAKLECVNGVCPNGCWGYQRRTSGFACDYDATAGDRVKTRDGGAAFASYNEIKSLHPDDNVAVANCKAQSGHKLRTYAVWNGAGWDNEGIAAAVRFAELYGPQNEAMPDFTRWYQSYRGSWSPMNNISPETSIDFEGVKRQIPKIGPADGAG